LIGLLLPALIAAAPAQEVQRHTTVFFVSDAVDVPAEAEPALGYVARALLDHPGLKVRLSGRSDRTGTTEYDLARSKRMADAVARWLHDHGVVPGRITVIALGAPANGEPNPLNRRVEIDLIG
jgi:outer membrane protein OmpA-like peptidoglycan-associated protein